MWYGAIGNIPSGWVLCNGANGTPDLRNKFIVGAGDTYAVDETGGAVEHTHVFLGDGHFHEVDEGSDIGDGYAINDFTDSAIALGESIAASSLPPYHSLCYIMKT